MSRKTDTKRCHTKRKSHHDSEALDIVVERKYHETSNLERKQTGKSETKCNDQGI